MRWEYLIQRIQHGYRTGHESTAKQELDAFGEDGWELVAVLPENDTYCIAFLKRRLPQDEEMIKAQQDMVGRRR